MRRAIGTISALIVGLQILVGVPLAVCLLFFALAGGGGVGPLAVEVHAGHEATIPPPAIASGAMSATAIVAALPPNVIPHPLPVPLDNPILESRAQHGSPLAGTVLGQSVGAEAEQQLFVAAFEKVAAESSAAANPVNDSSFSESAAEQPTTDVGAATACQAAARDGGNLREKATQFAIQQLYAMADVDEQAGEFDRADQWRSLARELCAASAHDPSPARSEPQ